MRNKIASTRINAEESKMLDAFSKLEGLDRAALLRRLLHLGMESYRETMAVQAYAQGKTTLSRSAELAGVSLWEMMGLLGKHHVELNYESSDLEQDLTVLKKLRAA